MVHRVAVDVVHEDVESSLLARDPIEEPLDLRRNRVIDTHRDSDAAVFGDHLCGLVDRLRPFLRDQIPTRAPRGAVDRGTCLAEHACDSAAGSARGSGDYGDFSFECFHVDSIGHDL